MPEVLLVNPRRRRRKATTTRRRRKVARVRRRRVRRANPVMHHRRRRVHARRHNPRRRSRRIHRNPLHLGDGNVFMRATGIVVAGLAVDILASKLAAMLPAAWATNADVVRIGTKAAITIGVPMLAKRVKIIPANVANAIAIGGAVVTVMDIVNTYVKPHLPAGLLADYESDYPGVQGYEQGALTGYEEGVLSGGAYGDGAYQGGIGV